MRVGRDEATLPAGLGEPGATSSATAASRPARTAIAAAGHGASRTPRGALAPPSGATVAATRRKSSGTR